MPLLAPAELIKLQHLQVLLEEMSHLPGVVLSPSVVRTAPPMALRHWAMAQSLSEELSEVQLVLLQVMAPLALAP